MPKIDSYATLESKIEALADEEAQAAIKAFRASVAAALSTLLGEQPHAFNAAYSGPETHYPPQAGVVKHYRRENVEAARAALLTLVSDKPEGANSGWPSVIWDKRRAGIRDRVLATFNDVQRLLVVPPPDASKPRCEPATATETAPAAGAVAS